MLAIDKFFKDVIVKQTVTSFLVVKMARGDKLRSTNKMTPEELREFSRKGGKASGVAKRKQKTLKELANLILSKTPQRKIKKFIQENIPGIEDEDITYKTAMMFGQIKAAIDGNTRAFKQIQLTIGEEPKGDSRAEDKIDEYFDKLEMAFKEDGQK